ncbi:MAG: tRNA(Ile)(2)-agmatinylcytidine synthase [Methanosarcinales archaeon Met12]|nr:MAG: tRNA(Ile)(2)-agmatinylcytidine synthase [Methanosarcinales archaeon Met12]
MFIGIDDTDSKMRMCTTYLAAVLVERLQNYGVIVDHPKLIRLNPNVRYKTRGNGAIAIQIHVNEGQESQIEDIVVGTVKEMAELDDPNTNPGIVFLDAEVPPEITEFSRRVIQDVVTIPEAMELAKRYGKVYSFKNGRGVIGALAAIGATLEEDFTYELIAYRQKGRYGTPRNIDKESVLKADQTTYPLTWDTVDVSNDIIVFAPSSSCPVLFGIRGDDINAIQNAFEIIKSEPLERHILFKTNHGTDAHLMHEKISSVKNERSYILSGVVVKQPHSIRGGHVFFTVAENGHNIDCAAYEPTKGFRDVVRRLCVGDEVVVYGALNFRRKYNCRNLKEITTPPDVPSDASHRCSICDIMKNRTINLEKIEIVSLADQFIKQNPVCTCGKRMKSAGRHQGYRCKKCGTAADKPEHISIKRDLEIGLYEVPPSARRHISKPLVRVRGKKVHPVR